jgi:hypothetical protein
MKFRPSNDDRRIAEEQGTCWDLKRVKFDMAKSGELLRGSLTQALVCQDARYDEVFPHAISLALLPARASGTTSLSQVSQR